MLCTCQMKKVAKNVNKISDMARKINYHKYINVLYEISGISC